MFGRTNKGAWFVKVRGSYLPRQGIGLVVYFAYVAYLICLVASWYVYGHTLWNLLVYVIPLSVAAELLTSYIASKHSS